MLNIAKGLVGRRSILIHRGEFANTCTLEQETGGGFQCLFLDLTDRRGYLAKEMSRTHILPMLEQPVIQGNQPTGAGAGREAPRARTELPRYYEALLRAHGPQHWWPGRTPFEVVVGAILTQNTTWTNVERAIARLRRHRLLTPSAMERVPRAKLARLIRSSGYFHQKARKLQAFLRFLKQRHRGSLARMLRTPTAILRAQLLEVHGIGPETADSILLYAGEHPVFVVDAYTRRILERHQLVDGKEPYEEIRRLFEQSLPPSVSLFNEYHALIVHTGKHFCRKRRALCAGCALRPFLGESTENL
jgi:endonuclease III related protein